MYAIDILNSGDNWDVLESYYKGLLTGNGGQTYCRLYLDLNNNELFQSSEPSSNTWIGRDDGSLVEIHSHNNYGFDLSQDDLEHLEQYGVDDFEYQEFVFDIEDRIGQKIDGRTVDCD